MLIGYARVSTTEQNLGSRHDDLKPAYDASVDQTEARSVPGFGRGDCDGHRAALIGSYPESLLEAPALSRSSFLGRAAVPAIRCISGSFGLNQCFRLAAQDVRLQPVVQVQPEILFRTGRHPVRVLIEPRLGLIQPPMRLLELS